MSRQENLTVIKGGLNRQRTKGAALKDSLFDLLNGFVTTEKTVKVRPGTLRTDLLTTGTVGLVSFGGKFHVFSTTPVAGLPANYVLHLLRSPSDTATVSRIHFAEPFLGVLYVSAEFDDTTVFHFWLRDGETWEADKIYDVNTIVEPAVDDGFAYRATRAVGANPTWTEGAPRAIGDKVEPSIENGFHFEVAQIFGPKAISSGSEPDWADAKDGELFNEDVDGTIRPNRANPPGEKDDSSVPDGTETRYGKKRSGSPKG